MSKVVLSTFDGSGIMVLRYAEAGHKCYCVNADEGDHGAYEVRMEHPNITYVNAWIDSNFNPEDYGIPKPDIIFGFPPCTMLAGCGSKHERSAEELEEALANIRIVEALGNKYNVPWMIENPVGKLSTLWRKPDFYFDPYEYGGYLFDEEGSFHPKMPTRDGYTKKTCIWYGNGFVKPVKKPVEHIGCFWGWKSLGGASAKTKQLRSLTARGFARAVFLSNNLLDKEE